MNIQRLKQNLLRESLIEFCALPSIGIHNIFLEIGMNTDAAYLDSIGNLSYFTSTLPVNTLEEFSETVYNLSEQEKEFVFVDSMTFVSDICDNREHIKDCYNSLWNLIYKTKTTVIVSNHYKKVFGSENIEPRLGVTWHRLISQQVFVKDSEEGYVFELLNFDS